MVELNGKKILLLPLLMVLKPNLAMKCSKGLKSTSNCLLSETKR